MIKKFPYESCFAEITLKPIVSTDKDKCLALASLAEVSSFLPSLDTEANLDLLPVAFNACVVNRVNKNRDVVDTPTALAMYKSFINKPINVEHNRQKVIGMILTAGFSEFGSDRALTEEQVKSMTGQFNITLGGAIWRVVCPELSDHIEDSSDPTSDNYLSVSASWELGFTDYRVALLPAGCKNLSEASKIISDPKEVEEVKDKLTSLGGNGKIEDLFAYRMPSYSVLPLGIGFTEKPAAEVKGVATPQKDDVGIVIPEAFDDGSKDTPKVKPVPIPNPGESNKIGIVIPQAFGNEKSPDLISQVDKINVKKEEHMKINTITDITDESLKQCSASVISEFISSELKKGNDEWVKQKSALNTQLSQAQETSTKLQAEQTKLQEELKKVQATVESLSAEKIEREKVEKFNVRMSAINESYNLDDDMRAAIAEDIKAIASDEDFTKWEKKASVLFKGLAKTKTTTKTKTTKDGDDNDGGGDTKIKVKVKVKADDDDDADGSKKKAKASEEAQAAIEHAADNGTTETGGLPNGSSAAAPSLKEKYKNAFAMENIVIKV